MNMHDTESPTYVTLDMLFDSVLACGGMSKLTTDSDVAFAGMEVD